MSSQGTSSMHGQTVRCSSPKHFAQRPHAPAPGALGGTTVDDAMVTPRAQCNAECARLVAAVDGGVGGALHAAHRPPSLAPCAPHAIARFSRPIGQHHKIAPPAPPASPAPPPSPHSRALAPLQPPCPSPKVLYHSPAPFLSHLRPPSRASLTPALTYIPRLLCQGYAFLGRSLFTFVPEPIPSPHSLLSHPHQPAKWLLPQITTRSPPTPQPQTSAQPSKISTSMAMWPSLPAQSFRWRRSPP